MVIVNVIIIITFRVSRRRREMYIGHERLCACDCVCLSVRRRMPKLLHRPGCNLGMPFRCALLD